MKPSPKNILLFINLILFCFLHVILINAQSQDSCSSAFSLSSSSSIPFPTSNLVCVDVWPGQNYVLRYAQGGPNVWNFVLSAPSRNVYVGMGFSPNGRMVRSTAMVGWAGSNGGGNMRKYYLGGESPNEVIVQASDQGLNVANDTAFIHSDRIYMAFQLVTDRPSTRLIYSVGPSGFIPGPPPDYRLTQHEDMIATRLDFVTGQFQTTQGRPEASLRRTHGLLNMIGWAILLTIGAMVARYARRFDPAWFYAHAIIQLSGFILGVSGVICGLVLENRLGISVNTHKALGILVLVLGCLQVMAFLIRPNKEAKVRKYWNWYHFGVGRLLLVLAAVNVFYGIHLGNPGSSWNASFAIVLVIFFVITLIFELRMCFKK